MAGGTLFLSSDPGGAQRLRSVSPGLNGEAVIKLPRAGVQEQVEAAGRKMGPGHTCVVPSILLKG